MDTWVLCKNESTKSLRADFCRKQRRKLIMNKEEILYRSCQKSGENGMTKQTFEMTFAGKPLVVEIGQVAKQANGATLVRYGESTVLTAAVMSNKMARGDFFPLQVNYE